MALFKPEFGLVFWMLVVFLIILLVLAKYAWPFIIKSMEERAAFIDNGVKYTEEAIRRLEEAKESARVLLADAHRKQLETLQETEHLKVGMIDDAKKAAALEAKKVIEAAQLSIEQSKREAEMQMRKQVSKLSLDIAEKLLRKDLSSDASQAEMINTLLDEVEKK